MGTIFYLQTIKDFFLPSTFDKELKKQKEKERNHTKIQTPNSQSVGLFQMETKVNLGSHLPH